MKIRGLTPIEAEPEVPPAPAPDPVPVLSLVAPAPPAVPVPEPEYDPLEPKNFQEYAQQAIRTPEGRAQLRLILQASRAKWSFAEFFKQAWKQVEPNTELVWNWHHALVCCVLQAVFMDWLKTKHVKGYINLVRNVIFNLPPGSSKSRLIAVCFMAWCWLHWPGMKVIALSVNDDATMRDARDARALIQSPWYVSSFGVKWGLKKDQDAISNFGNTEGGERLSMPSRSEIVGLRADLILNDDPNNPKKAENRNERQEVNELWSTNQYNRVNDVVRSLRMGVQQRTNAGDWTGYAIDQQGVWSPENPDGWLWVVLPAEYEADRKFKLPEPLIALLKEYLPECDIITCDPRTVEGETLDVVRMPRSFLDSERRRWEGTGNYAGQMQQRPALVSGGMVQRAWFRFCRLAAGIRPEVDQHGGERPRPAHCVKTEAEVIHLARGSERWDFDWVWISVDAASKKTEKGSNYGLLVVAGKGGRRYVLDDRSQRGHLHEIIDVLKDMVRLWEPDCILIEPKAAGPDVMSELLKSMLAGDMPMITIEEAEPGNNDKEMRLEACLSYFKNSMVALLDGANWLEVFVEELSLFPHGLHDDRVDALSQALNHARENEDLTTMPTPAQWAKAFGQMN